VDEFRTLNGEVCTKSNEFHQWA